MFNEWNVDAATVGIKCEDLFSNVVHQCRAFCLNPNHSLTPGSISVAHCRATVFKPPKVGDGNEIFSKCGPPVKKSGQRLRSCGAITSKKHGISGAHLASSTLYTN